MPLDYDGRKLFIKNRKPTDAELRDLILVELTSLHPYKPHHNSTSRRRRKHDQTLSNVPLTKWRKRFAVATDDVIKQILQSTTQFAANVQDDNRMQLRRHLKPRFLFFHHRRINDVFHTDTYFPTVITAQSHKAAQMYVGKKSQFW